jgi:hypothetical protein
MDLADARSKKRFGAGTRSALVGAGLKCDDGDRIACGGSGCFERYDLCVRTTDSAGRPLPDDGTILHDDAADRRVGSTDTRCGAPQRRCTQIDVLGEE